MLSCVGDDMEGVNLKELVIAALVGTGFGVIHLDYR